MKKIEKIIIIAIALILIIILALSIIFIKDIQFFFAKNSFLNENYTQALDEFSNLDDKTKIEFIKNNISDNSSFLKNNFFIKLLDTVESHEYAEDKINIYLSLVKEGHIDNTIYEKIYNDAKEIDKNLDYESTKEIIYLYSKELISYYKSKTVNIEKYQNIIDNLMLISDMSEVTDLINKCNENIANIYISSAEKECSQTLYVDSINSYNKAIATLEHLNDSRYDEKIQKCKDEIKEVEKLSKDFTWCEAYGCIRHKAPGEAHYCSIHVKDPTAITPVATEKKENTSGYSYYHKCEYPGCTNYASASQYCSKHTTYNKCSYPGCNNSVSYSGAKYCSVHEIEKYNKNNK